MMWRAFEKVSPPLHEPGMVGTHWIVMTTMASTFEYADCAECRIIAKALTGTSVGASTQADANDCWLYLPRGEPLVF